MSNHQLFNENSHIAYIILDILNQPTIKRYSWYTCMSLSQRSNILYFVGPNVFMFIQVTVLNFHIFRETHLQCITTMSPIEITLRTLQLWPTMNSMKIFVLLNWSGRKRSIEYMCFISNFDSFMVVNDTKSYTNYLLKMVA